ncbi:MAG TPA: TolC family protein [Bryobacteraceae bacterium]|nr:TolC family protein [Bryobacteraceae bacterium]
MSFRSAFACVFGMAIILLHIYPSFAQSSGVLTLTRALEIALAANPRLSAADREIGVATGRYVQSKAIPNPELSFELDNALGSNVYRGTRSAESTLQLSQLVELGGKRQARIAVGAAELDVAHWQSAAVRLEILSETATAFAGVLSAQRRVRIFESQIVSLNRLIPLLQARIDAGASPATEISRAEVAADIVRAERERALTELAIARRELTTLMGRNAPEFRSVAGNLNSVGKPPPFQTLLRAVESNPQLMRFTSLRAQRDAEFLSARLKPIPDLRVAGGWRHYKDTGDDAVRLSLSVPLPVWDQNSGGILEAQEMLAKTDSERTASKAALILTLGKAYDTMTGSLRELEILRNRALPNARKAAEGTESGYSQGRFTLLDLLDAQNTATQTMLREQEVLIKFYTALVTIEGLTGIPLHLNYARPQ